MTLRHLSLAAVGAALCLVFALSPAFAAPEAGKVVALTPGAFVERAGKRLPLEMKSAVEAGDTLTTDATGRVRVLFSDDSSMSIGPNTVLALREFSPGGSKPAVKAHLGKGLLRAITGRIVEQNPDGFALTSPEATVGIRGTIITMRSDKGRTTVFVENTTRKVYVNGVHVPSGKKITVPGEPAQPVDIRPEDRREIGRDLAFRGGTGVAAAAPEPAPRGTAPGEQPQGATTILVAENALPTPETPLGGLPIADLNGGGPGLSGGTPPPSGPIPGTISGNLTHLGTDIGVAAFNGVFQFAVNLSSGAISQASMTGLGDQGSPLNAFSISATGGTGSFSGGAFTITGFTGAVTDIGIWGPSGPLDPGQTHLNGGGSYANVGDSVSITSYDLSMGLGSSVSNGTGSGTRTN